jgi:hypothetical protein
MMLGRLTLVRIRVYAALFADDLSLEEAFSVVRAVYQQLQAEQLACELPTFDDLQDAQEAMLQ